MPVILVVEDDVELQSMLRMALEDEGLEVEVAMDGREAREWVMRRRPSLVVLDWMLPDMNGGAVAQHIQAVHGADVPILLMTAAGRGAENAARIGAFACLPKPFDLDDLLETVQRAIVKAEYGSRLPDRGASAEATTDGGAIGGTAAP